MADEISEKDLASMKIEDENEDEQSNYKGCISNLTPNPHSATSFEKCGTSLLNFFLILVAFPGPLMF